MAAFYPCCRHCVHEPGHVHEMGCLLGCSDRGPEEEEIYEADGGDTMHDGTHY